MTRQEFIDSINYWGELIEFCYDNGCDYCDDLYDEDQWNRCVEDDAYEIIRNGSWRDVLSTLQDYENLSGYEFYRRDEYGERYGLDNNDFDQYKNDILAWADDNGIWGDDEGKSSQPYDTEDEVPLEDISFEELFA